jgi:hypothetical protein
LLAAAFGVEVQMSFKNNEVSPLDQFILVRNTQKRCQEALTVGFP